ncbi:MAG: protein phosphatase CheZ [Cellvibrionaceae bacterium]|nr:protein phosphatase CheZ [Cellvibrionaceae bacterium]
MENKTSLHNEQFLAQLQKDSSQLVEKLQNNDFDEATSLINTLVELRDSHIFNSVGKLTRALHSAIVNFHVDADFDSNPPEVNTSEIRDASDRLQYVIDLTQKAADTTMDKVEAIAPVAANLGQEAGRIRDEWKRLKRREMSKEEFKGLYGEVDGFLGEMELGTKELSNSLQDIILEQGYQDLTGQVLKRVIGLITDVERELVNLMRIAGQVEKVTGLDSEGEPIAAVESSTKGEGPQIHADKRDDVVSGQDDVDDLLSSLGF